MPPGRSGAASASHRSGVLGIALIVVERCGIVDVGYNRRVEALNRSVVGYIVAGLTVVGITLIFHNLIHVNPTTVALTFLLGVLAVSATWGLRHAVLMAVAATLAFNYFFLPPIRTFTIADPQNWVALVAFLVTAVVASQLSERARRETENANERRREVERLYAFSAELLSSENVAEILNRIPRYVVDSFEVRSAALSVSNRPDVYRSGPSADGLELHDLQLVAMRGEPKFDLQKSAAFFPLRMGARVVGSFGVSGTIPSRQTLDAIGSLIAVAVERAGTIEKLGRAEAARESEQLRSVLLDSVTHEFRTPLTSIKASVTSLLSSPQLDPSSRQELLTVINEESDRLNHLIGEAAEMAQLDAHMVELKLEPHSLRDAAQAALAESTQVLAQHPVQVHLPDDLPKVRVDLQRIIEVFRQLLENAAKYSPPESPIYITAEVKNQRVTASVADQGPGIDDFEQGLIFEKFYRGRNQRVRVQGTGMGLAIAKAIVEAHGGRMGLTSQVGHGSVFYFSLPISS
jgi:two-component system, OmpR family, sensor histidine kinase KdpD